MPPRRKEPKRKKPRPCYAGIDFGSSSSKAALAFLKTEIYRGSTGNDEIEAAQVIRVPLRAALDDPERSNASNQSSQQFEFNSSIAIVQEGDEDVVYIGRSALSKDLSIPLKTVFVWLAEIHNPDVLLGLPGGRDLEAALRDGLTLDKHMLRDAVLQHFCLIRDMLLIEAGPSASNLEIRQIILSYPCYLCEQEQEQHTDRRYYDLDRYQKYYLDCMREVWKEYPHMIFEWISEGHATAKYICEPFSDGNQTLDRPRMWREVQKLCRPDLMISDTESDGTEDADADADEDEESGTAHHINALVVDTGSSSVGIHYQCVYFDKYGDLIGSQSQGHEDTAPGTTGGSHLTNERIKAYLEERLRVLPDVTPGHLAELLQLYEEMKHDVDYTNLTEPLRFHTKDGVVNITIPQDAVRRIFLEVFAGGLVLLDREMERIISNKEDFIIVFCGGSYLNPGLRRTARQHVQTYQRRAKEAGIAVEYMFLADYDTAPRVAVACGAAVSGLRVPKVGELLRGSAAGIQVSRRLDHDDEPLREDIDQWDKEKYADFLFSRGCLRLPHINYRFTKEEKDALRFTLCIDPNYFPCDKPGPPRRPVSYSHRIKSRTTGLLPATGTTRDWGRLPINAPSYAPNVPALTYELGFHIYAQNLPDPPICFYADGTTVKRLAEANGTPEDPSASKITIELFCCKVNLKSGKVEDDPMNTQWKLLVRSDPGSNFLNVGSYRTIPVTCRGSCGAALRGTIYICNDCRLVAFCSACYHDDILEHFEGHTFDEVDW